MTTKFPASDALLNARRRHARADLKDVAEGTELRNGFWTGTREGLISTAIAVVAALVFGGAAGVWFAPDSTSWVPQLLRVGLGTVAMGALVSLTGTWIAGRNPVFWGVGMPLLVYVAGTFCAFISAYPGAGYFLVGSPLLCGLAIASGVMTAFAADRDG